MQSYISTVGLNKFDWKSAAKGLLIALAGAALTYLANWIKLVDFGTYTPMVTALAAVLFNIALKALDGNKPTQ